MKISISSILLILTINVTTKAQLSIQKSGFGNSNAELLTRIKNRICSFSETGQVIQYVFNKIDSSTQILRLYDQFFVEAKDYNYSKNIVNYLHSPYNNFRLLLIQKNASKDSLLLGTASLQPLFDSCYSVSLPHRDLRENISSIGSLVHKIDFNSAALFIIRGGELTNQESEICLLQGGQVYVVKNGKLLPFNEYYKKKFSLKKFKWYFRNIEIK